jgi:hypothetical protein
MKFAYTALTGDNKKITGVLDVENEAAAQGELHKMGVAILQVKQITDEEYEKLKASQEAVKDEKGIQTFSFVAADPSGKEIEGTIDAEDAYSAYKRLKEEYQFRISNLFEAGATDDIKEASKAQIATFEAQLEQEKAILEAQGGGEKKGDDDDEEEEETEINKELIEEIDRVIINTKKVMETHSELFSNELIKEIENTLGTLERIRTSNNVKHITEVSNELYELVSNPDKTEGEAGEAFHSLKDQIGDSALVRREFEIYQKALQATGVKKVFENIAKRLKDMTAPPDEESGKPAGPIGKIKAKIHNITKGYTERKRKLAREELIKKAQKKPKGKFGVFMEKFSAYMKTTNPILKKARKKEMIRAFHHLIGKETLSEKEELEREAKKQVEKQQKAEQKEAVKAVEKETRETAGPKAKKNLTGFFVEVDSFLGWLLSFYIIYFYLVGFSLEKNIGLSREFILKTLKTPLILNITLLLLILHLALRIRNLHFRGKVLLSGLILITSLGAYALLVINF